ncbi:MAG: hypothetical protein P4N60_08310 [Verrucomicrobiae bacterium]|nr:hypothetical protein [Verrucomicrobiae bacterium]
MNKKHGYRFSREFKVAAPPEELEPWRGAAELRLISSLRLTPQTTPAKNAESIQAGIMFHQ